VNLFPVFLKLGGRPCLVVGAETVGEGKIRGLLEAGAEVRVVAPHAGAAVKAWARAGQITWHARPFAASDLEGAFLVVVATPRRELNDAVFRQAQQAGILCNVVDDPERCDFYYPSVVQRADFQIAISTGGHSPFLAQRLRQEFEQTFGPEYGVWVEWLGKVRRRLFRMSIDPERRRGLLRRLASREQFETFIRRRASRDRTEVGADIQR